MRFAVVVALLLAIPLGCSVKQKPAVYRIPESHFHALTVGMNRGQVDRSLGVPPRHVGEKKIASRKVEVFCYSIPPGDDPENIGSQKEYYLYFFDDRLAGWGSPGDWEKEAEKIFRSPPR
jgi:hypothetical protein